MEHAFESLRSIIATRTRRVIVWCGAGLSAPAGIPTWPALQRRLETALADRLQSLEVPEAQRDAKLKAIKQEPNPWVAFHRLQTELGITSFRETVKGALAKAATVQMPGAYNAIWKLRPSGLVNLNLDRLATRAAAESQVGGLIEFKGKEIGPYTYTLNSPRPFICNIHGVEEDVDSWVFTQPTLRELAESPAYQHYLAAVLTTSTVLFLGITADDVAVGGHLERLVSLGIRPQTHYWITDRRDPATDAWAEKNNVLVIRYKPSSTEHPELIKLLEDLASYVQPEDDSSPPVALELDFGAESIAPQNTLVTLPAERIRSELNRYASHLLKEGGNDAIAAYEKFSKEYDRSIHAAWYTSTEPGENDFLGYKLKEEVARGAFGIVFRAVNGNGDEFAIKVLHAEIRRKAELLNAFRRGVRSMRILGEKNVEGMVRYHGASEIPATLIMDWIDGPNLNQVVESGTLDDWERILDIGKQLAEIIASAHALPERVLHRDIRPPNMIISGYWDGEVPLRVKVLDFDLSWHRGSVEKSVIFGSQLSGYLAPEQVQRRVGVSTQHASVDSYGLGMTLFYMVAARNPVPGEHAHSNWRETLDAVSRRPRGTEWKSLARRIARLIFFATQERQEKRWDVVQIRSELRRLYEAHSGVRNVRSAELLAEEIAARCALLKDYVWNDERFSVEHNFGTGLSVSLRGDESAQEVNLVLTRIANEATDRNRLGDMITRARDAGRTALSSAGWGVYADVGQGMLTIRASISCSEMVGKLDQVVDSVRRAIERTTFS